MLFYPYAAAGAKQQKPLMKREQQLANFVCRFWYLFLACPLAVVLIAWHSS